MRKLITLTLSILLLGLFATVVFAAVDPGDDPSSATGTTETSQTTGTTGTTETTTTDDTTTTPGDDAAEDISGPCDEAEHANDPRCTGTGGDRVDNSGPGSVDSGHGDDADDDDNSGHGGGDDDSSGHGGGGGDDSSGHGGGDDD